MTTLATRVGLRSRLLIAVVAAVGAAVVVLVGALNVFVDRRLDADAMSLLRARSSDEIATLSTVDGRLAVPEAPDAGAFDSPTWILSGHRVLERPAAAAAVDRAALAMAAGTRREHVVADPHTRLLAVPVIGHGRSLGTVVSGISLEPYDRTKRTTLVGSLIFGALLLAAVAAVARWVLAAALSPVARMTASADEWSDRDLDRRFGMGPPRDELTALAATLDGLLDRVAEGLRRERRFSAELSHELRTPLTRITTEAQLAVRDAGHKRASDHAALEAILGSAREMARTLDALMEAARTELAGQQGSGDALAAARSAVAACDQTARARGVTIELVPERHVPEVACSEELVERILHPLLSNAIRFARSRVEVGLARAADEVVVNVCDDGPGVAEHDLERIFEAGARGRSDHVDAGGAGLGLALARRLASSAQARIEVAPGPGGRFSLRLPAL